MTLFAVLVMAVLGLSGLAIDGGQVFVARRDTQALADAAARAGARRDPAARSRFADGALYGRGERGAGAREADIP